MKKENEGRGVILDFLCGVKVLRVSDLKEMTDEEREREINHNQVTNESYKKKN